MRHTSKLSTYFPILDWARRYRREEFASDLLAGVIVTIMLVPQGMAYALLAGLPPQVGLYASIVPLMLYGLLGTSRILAVGPVAIISLMVAAAIAPLADGDVSRALQLAVTLALMVGVIQVMMGLLRAGFLVNFLSHPVLTGFTSAAAIIIGFSQVKHILGIAGGRGELLEMIPATLAGLGDTNWVTLLLGGGGIGLLFYFKHGLAGHLRRGRVPEGLVVPITRSAPLVLVVVTTLVTWALNLPETAAVSIVGAVPAGLPPLSLPIFDLQTWRALLPAALAISFVGYMESISVAKSLASKRRQKVVANQELVALGAANLGAAFTGGYPVTGGLSRSVVNYAAGAKTGMASIVTAVLIALTVIFLTPLFYYLPNAALGAIIIVAVTGLVDVQTWRHVWRYNRADAATLMVTFVAVLGLGIENGILVGVLVAMVMFIWRTSRPHVAVVGRLGSSEIYRNVKRHPVQTWPSVIAMRPDESLYFANTKFLEDTMLRLVAEQPEVAHFVLIGTAINFIDASALETLESLHHDLRDAGVTLHLAAIKGPVMDRLHAIGFIDAIGLDHVHLSTHDAMIAIGAVDDAPIAVSTPLAVVTNGARSGVTP